MFKKTVSRNSKCKTNTKLGSGWGPGEGAVLEAAPRSAPPRASAVVRQLEITVQVSPPHELKPVSAEGNGNGLNTKVLRILGRSWAKIQLVWDKPLLCFYSLGVTLRNLHCYHEVGTPVNRSSRRKPCPKPPLSSNNSAVFLTPLRKASRRDGQRT